jgi:hypothetical protein
VLRRLGAVAVLLLAVACGGSGDDQPETVTVGGERLAVAPLVDAHAGLCEAARQPAQARALFFDRSHEALHTVARALEDVDRAQAAELLQAKELVESGLADPAQSLQGDLSRLAEVYRTSLGRLAITAPPCDK